MFATYVCPLSREYAVELSGALEGLQLRVSANRLALAACNGIDQLQSHDSIPGRAHMKIRGTDLAPVIDAK